MKRLLRLLSDELFFLLSEARYTLTGSAVGQAYGDALIELRGEKMKWRLVSDRSQLFLDCASLLRPS